MPVALMRDFYNSHLCLVLVFTYTCHHSAIGVIRCVKTSQASHNVTQIQEEYSTVFHTGIWKVDEALISMPALSVNIHF